MNNFSYTKNKKLFFLFTAVCIILGVICIMARGVNWDVDFKGGTELNIKVTTEDKANLFDNVEKITKEIVGNDFSSVTSVSDSTGDSLLVKCNEIDTEKREEVLNKISEKYGAENVVLLSTNSVSGAISDSLRKSAVVAISVAVVLMLLYIAIRFKPLSAIAAVICLIHDIFFVFVAYSLLQIPVNSNIIAVALTILGYSINATIVIFDRIRENNKVMGSGVSFEDKANVSVKQTLRRSIFTTITTLLTIGMVYILGVTSIKNFALPLIIGIVAGLYSSVCLSGNLWVVFDKAFGKKK
ncbi:MAG: protein translocase subunit SecF [Clostridia bacterium]|nr:protein translocase subunit SecF [Clostridia bacterium]